MAAPPLYILVRLWIHRGLVTEFEAYERKVSRIMVRYGGVIERVIRTSGASDGRSDEPFEVHVLRFPSRDLYDAYRDDAERLSLSGERAGIITNTDSGRDAGTDLWLLILFAQLAAHDMPAYSRPADLMKPCG